jgi:hypothetical protein
VDGKVQRIVKLSVRALADNNSLVCAVFWDADGCTSPVSRAYCSYCAVKRGDV